MGYNPYITRRKNHIEEEGPSISEEEWRDIVEADPSLSFKHEDYPLTAFWDGKCEYPDPWFDYSAAYGSIDTKNPDDTIINKMLEMASKFDAKVQGDDGEIYRSSADTYYEDDDEESDSNTTPWWKRLLGLT